MRGVVLTEPGSVDIDLSTRGALLRYDRLRRAGFSVRSAMDLSDAGLDVIGFAVISPLLAATGSPA